MLAVASLAAAWCCAAASTKEPPRTPSPERPIVHEWGTFSTFSGSDGRNLKFEPYDNDLPDFVHGYRLRNSKEGPAGGTISLETPVLYFYAKQPFTASVEVEFPKGIITEWYPHAARKDTRLAWRGIEVLPQQDNCLPTEPKESRYYAARETDAAQVRVNYRGENGTDSEQERFLFYRGVGSFDMPLSVRALDNGRLSVRWRGEGPDADLIVVQVNGKKVRFRPFRLERLSGGAAQAEVKVPAVDSAPGELGDTIVKILTSRGLYEKEARAMVKTWSSAWFGEEGTRVLYILPERLTGEFLPLKVQPGPAALVRVLVGRHDVLTPDRERQIDNWVAELSRPDAEKDQKGKAAADAMRELGRYFGAAWHAADQRLKGKR
jgi:hypothetical protein